MFNLQNIFKVSNIKEKEKIAQLLKTTPEALKAFEKTYTAQVLDKVSDNFFEINSKQATQINSTLEEHMQ